MRAVSLFRSIIFVVLLGEALGDLSCQTYMPHNWTTKYARLNLFEQDFGQGPSPIKTIPANFSATNPLSLASKSVHGDTFYLRSCQSKSLNLHSEYSMSPSYCSASKKARSVLKARQSSDCSYLCEYSWFYAIQVIHNGTGHCLTTQNITADTSVFDFKPCDVDPKDASQFFGATRIEYYNNNYGIVGPVCDWQPEISISPLPNGSKYKYFSWDLASDNKTLIRDSGGDLQINALAIDPLTTYSNKAN